MNGRRVFTEVAAALAKAEPFAPDEHEMKYAWRKSCRAVADAFAGMNQAFDRERFLADCGITEG